MLSSIEERSSDRLEDIGDRLGVSSNDIRKIKGSRTRLEIARVVLSGVTPIAAFVAGYLVGKAQEQEPLSDTYPYAAAILASLRGSQGGGGGASRRRMPAFLAVVVLAIAAAVVGHVIGSAEPSYGTTTKYGVYGRLPSLPRSIERGNME